MSETFIFLLLAAFCILVGAFLGNLFARLKHKGESGKLEAQLENYSEQEEKLNHQIQTIDDDRKTIRNEKESLSIELERRKTEYHSLQEEIQREKERFKTFEEDFKEKFENLANKIFEDKSKKFTDKNKENIDGILKPLQEKIEKFEKKVDDSQKENLTIHSALKQQLIGLKDLNQQMSQEALNLTKALKGDNKSQGDWGELILENALEKSGLQKGLEYEIQHGVENDEGKRVLPDVIINLPQGKKMIIDSKVSLVAYEQYANSDNKDDKKRFLKQHINSIKKHISELSAKKYEDLYRIESPDFVLMFMPIEPALHLAQNEDRNFFYTAFQNNILLVSPTTLLATLRTIDTIWNNEKQQQNAIDIAKHATSLYGKFKNLLDDLETIGNRIKSTDTAYQGAMKKLTGNQNLIKDIDKLEKLGISPKAKINKKWIDRATQSDDTQRDRDDSPDQELIENIDEKLLKRADEEENS